MTSIDPTGRPEGDLRQTPTRRASVWLLPTPADTAWLREHIAALAGRYQGDTFAPHLTVRGGLVARQADLRESIAETAKTVPVADVAGFAPAYGETFFQSIYLRCAPFATLMMLRQALTARFGEPDGPPPVPHVSLLYGDQNADQRRRIVRQLCDAALPTGLRFDHVAVVDHGHEITDVSAWRTVACYPLALDTVAPPSPEPNKTGHADV